MELFDRNNILNTALPKKSRGFKRLKSCKVPNKEQPRTDSSEDSNFEKKLKTKGSGLKLSLQVNYLPTAPESNCEAREGGLLDKTQMENIKLDEENANLLLGGSSNIGTARKTW